MAVGTFFDGTNDEIVLSANDFTMTSTFSVWGVVYINTMASDRYCIAAMNGANPVVAVRFASTNLVVDSQGGSPPWFGAVANTTYYYFCITKAAGTVVPKAYLTSDGTNWTLDGAAAGAGTLDNLANGTITDFRIGSVLSSNFWNGEITALGVSNTELSAATAKSLIDYSNWAGVSGIQFNSAKSMTSGGTVNDTSSVNNDEASRVGATAGSQTIPSWFVNFQDNFSSQTLQNFTSTATGTVNNPPAAVYVKEVGFVTNSTAGSTSVITTAGATVPIGDYLVIYGACDNAGSGGIATTIAVADNSAQAGSANTYTLQTPQAIADPVGASAGSQGFFVVCPVTRSIPAGTTITITYGNSLTAKAINCQQFTPSISGSISVLASSYATQDNQTGQAVSVAAGVNPTMAGQVVCTLVSVEGGTADAFTQDTDTTNGTWTTLTRRGSGTTTSGITLNSTYKALTAAGAQTYDHATMLGTARDHCAAIMVLTPPPITGTVAVTLQPVVGAASGTHTAGGATGTVAVTLQNFTSTATGLADIVGTSARTLANFTSTATGTETITGTSAQTLANFTGAATGSVANGVTGTVAVTLANFTSTATGTETITGTSARTLANFVGAATGTVANPVTGTVAVTLQNFVGAASGSSLTGVTGTVAVTLANFTSTTLGRHLPWPFIEPFTYSNGSLSATTPDLWTTVTGTIDGLTLGGSLQVASNHIASPTNELRVNQLHPTLPLPDNNQYGQILVTPDATTQPWGALVGIRGAADGLSGYAAWMFWDTGGLGGYQYGLFRLDNGTNTTLGSLHAADGSPHTIKVTAVGNTITLYVDNVQTEQVTDSTYPTAKGLSVGLYGFVGASPQIDNLEAGTPLTVVTGTSATTLQNFSSTATGTETITGTVAVTLQNASSTAGAVTGNGVVLVGEIGSWNSATPESFPIAVPTSQAVPVGDLIVILGAVNNYLTGGGADTGIAAFAGAETFTLLTPAAIADPGAANEGVQTFILYASVVVEDVSRDGGIAVAFATATLSSWSVLRFAGANLSSPVLASSYAVQNNQTGQSVSVGTGVAPTSAGQIVLAAVGVEGDTTDGFTQDTDTTNGTWQTLPRRSAGTGTSGVTLNQAYKVTTAAGTQTYDHATMLGTARDHCAAVLVLDGIGVAVTGTAAVTLQNFTSNATGAETISGTVAVTLQPFTSNATGSMSVPGTLNQTLQDFVGAATGTVANPVSGTVAVTLQHFTSTATGTETITGTSAQTLQNFTGAATGSVANGVSGTVAVTLQPFTSTATGTETISGTSATTLQNFTGAVAGTVANPVTGTVAVTLQPFVGAATGSETITGTSARTLANFTSNASGTVANPVSGTVAVTLQNFTAAVAGDVTNPGSNGASVLDNFTSNATGSVVITGTVAVTLANFTATATGSLTIAGSVAVTLQPFTSTATGITQNVGTSAQTLQPFTSNASGTVTVAAGSAAVTLQPFTSNASGSVIIVGTTAAVLQNFTANTVGATDITGTVAVTLQHFTSNAAGQTAVLDFPTTDFDQQFTVLVRDDFNQGLTILVDQLDQGWTVLLDDEFPAILL